MTVGMIGRGGELRVLERKLVSTLWATGYYETLKISALLTFLFLVLSCFGKHFEINCALLTFLFM